MKSSSIKIFTQHNINGFLYDILNCRIPYFKTLLVFIFAVLTFSGDAAENPARENIYIRAMQEEVQRNMENLMLDRMLPPDFISYHIVDANVIQISAVLGGIVQSRERRIVRFDNRTMVIRDGISSENFLDLDNLGGSWSRFEHNLPLTGNDEDLRRPLWLVTDEKYKTAVSTYEAKISSMRQQNLSAEERELPDFLPAGKEEIIVPYHAMDHDRSRLEDISRSISGVFSRFGRISTSQVKILAYDGQVFYHNSEGTIARYPFQVAAVLVTASAQAESGELIFDHLLHFANDLSSLPSKETLVSEALELGGYLDRLTGIPPLEEPYFGPVLFEGQAAGEVFSRMFFDNTDGLIARRKPIIGDDQIVRFASDWVLENNLEPMMGRRIISRDINIDAFPGMVQYNGENLFGSYSVDAEGLPVKDHVNLVENGILNGMLSSRTPTLKVRESNAHARLALSRGSVRTVTAPGVIKMSINEEASRDIQELRQMLLEQAIFEGLDYAYIVRKVVSPAARFAQEDPLIFMRQTQQNRDFSKTIQVYRIYVEDGREEPVSMAAIKGLNLRSFRRILGASNDMQVYNTIYTPPNTAAASIGFDITGVPVTYILPQALLFEELDIVRESQQVIRKEPVVENPVKR